MLPARALAGAAGWRLPAARSLRRTLSSSIGHGADLAKASGPASETELQGRVAELTSTVAQLAAKCEGLQAQNAELLSACAGIAKQVQHLEDSIAVKCSKNLLELQAAKCGGSKAAPAPRDHFRPTLDLVANQVNHASQLDNDTLACLAIGGDGFAIRERLLREIMQTDGCSWEEAHDRLIEMDEFNERWCCACFRDVYVVSINLTAEEDVYDPRGAEHNPNWVSGPNAVFRHILNMFLGSNYSTFFLMEIDAIPRQPGWLEQYVAEVDTPSPWAISGSRYRGDNWDDFLSRMPEALLVHINGNAIYNVSHPFLAWIGEQLDREADTEMNSIAYDVRISEIILEAQAGETPEFAEAWEEHVPAGARVYNPGSRLIANFANTLLNQSFASGSYIVHGSPRNIFPELDESRVTLAMSEFSGANWRYFEASVNSYHPFRKIALLTTDQTASDGAVESYATPRGTTEMTWKVSQQPAYMSLCEVASLVDTEFFVAADTFHVIASPVSILMDGDAPVLPYLNSTSKYCISDARCTSSLAQAERLFNVTLEAHYDKHDTLFRTDFMQPFCEAWAVAANGSNFETCGLDFGPTADDYIAWMRSQGLPLEEYYKEVSREVKGWRSWLQLVNAHPPDPRSCGVYTADRARWMRGNLSSCHKYVESPGACNADARCMWRPIFQTGKCIPFNVATKTRAGRAKTGGAGGGGNTTTTNTTTTTVTITTTTPLIAVAASVLIPINFSRITEELVGSLLLELEEAAQEVKNGVSDADYVEAPGVRVELTEVSSVILAAPPTPVQKQIYFDSIREVRCGVMTQDQCDVQEFNSTVGLRATQGAKPRRLQDGSGYELRFEVFMIVHEAEDMEDTVPIDDPRFMDQLVVAVATRVVANAELLANETAASNTTSTLELISLGSFTRPEASALTVVELRVQETAPIDITTLQAEVAEPARITQAMTRSTAASTLVGVPTVDLCLGRTCGGNGVCQAGVCLCDAGWNPPNCLLPITSTATTTTSTISTVTSTASTTTDTTSTGSSADLEDASNSSTSQEDASSMTTAPPYVSAEADTQAALISIAVLAGISGCSLCCLCCRFAVLRARKPASDDDNQGNEDDNALEDEEEVDNARDPEEEGSCGTADPAFADDDEEPDLPTPVPDVNEVCVVAIRPTAFEAEGQAALDQDVEPDVPDHMPVVRAFRRRPSGFETENLGNEFETDNLDPVREASGELLAGHGPEHAAEDDVNDIPIVADEAQASPRSQATWQEDGDVPQAGDEAEGVGGSHFVQMSDDEEMVFV